MRFGVRTAIIRPIVSHARAGIRFGAVHEMGFGAQNVLSARIAEPYQHRPVRALDPARPITERLRPEIARLIASPLYLPIPNDWPPRFSVINGIFDPVNH